MVGPRLFASKYPSLFPNKFFAVALLSYGGELFAMILAGLLPAIAGIEFTWDTLQKSSLESVLLLVNSQAAVDWYRQYG